MPDEREHPGIRLNGWMVVVIVFIVAAAAVAITALVTRGSGTMKAVNSASLKPSTTTTTTLATPRTSSLVTYSTGQPNAGWPTYDLFTGDCSSFVAIYQYSWMGVTSAQTPITLSGGGFVQLVGSQATDTTVNVSSAPTTISLPAGLPYPRSDQGGVLVAGHDSLISYKCR